MQPALSIPITRRRILGFTGYAAVCLSCAKPSLAREVFDRAVYVDLQNAWLYAIDGPRIALASRVVVGRKDTPTPSVTSHITRVNFRPSWRPTSAMLQRGEYEDGIRPPGPDNPLGLASIHFTDGGLIYLHGTNRPELYNETFRALSSGCVRVEELAELISWLLDWSMTRTQEALDGPRTFSVSSLRVPLIMARPEDDPILDLLAAAARPSTT